MLKSTHAVALIAAGTLLAISGQATLAQSQVLKIQGVEYGYTPTAIELFEKANPDIKVEYSNQQPVFEDGSVQTQLRSGSGADVLYISTGPARIGLLIRNDLLPNLDDVWSEGNLKQNMLAPIVDAVSRYSGGHWYEVPNGMDIFQVAYNKQIFEQLGVSVPKTWDEFIAICDKAKAAGITPIVAGYRDGLQAGWMFGQVVQAVAGREVASDVLYGDGPWDQPAMIKAAQVLKQWFDAGYMDAATVSALDSKQEQAAFYAGGGAMSFLGNTHVLQAQANGQADPANFDVFPLPSPNPDQAPAATAGIGSSWVMNPGTKVPEAAKKWLEWAASEDFAKLMVESGGGSVPARILPADVKALPLMQNAIAQAPTAGYNPSVVVGARTKDAWYAAGQGIASGQLTPEAAMANLQAAKEQDAAAQ